MSRSYRYDGEKSLMKKSMTKKKLKEKYSERRSVVGSGMNLGTRVHMTDRDRPRVKNWDENDDYYEY